MWLLLIVFAFVIVDAIVHLTFKPLEVYYYPIPSFLLFISSVPLFWYVIGKIIGTIILGALAYPVLKRIKGNLWKSVGFTLFIIILLEVRYALTGYYGWIWHEYNLINHGVAFFVISYLVFRYGKVFEN